MYSNIFSCVHSALQVYTLHYVHSALQVYANLLRLCTLEELLAYLRREFYTECTLVSINCDQRVQGCRKQKAGVNCVI